MNDIIDNQYSRKFFSKHKAIIQIILIASLTIFSIWLWRFASNDEAELKLYAVQAIAEILFAVFEIVAIFLTLKAIRQTGEANREMKKMNERLQQALFPQMEVLKKQQEFYELQIKEKKEELKQQEKTKTLNIYLSYVRNFLFAYNRNENFDSIDTSKMKKIKDFSKTEQKMQMLKAILDIKLTPYQNLEQYIFTQENIDKNGKITQKLIFTENDKEIKDNFDCLLREYKYKLRTKLKPILESYFKNFDNNEELQEICG